MEGLYRAGSEAGAQTPPLLRASSPLEPKINRELTSKVVQQTGALHFATLPIATIVPISRHDVSNRDGGRSRPPRSNRATVTGKTATEAPSRNQTVRKTIQIPLYSIREWYPFRSIAEKYPISLIDPLTLRGCVLVTWTRGYVRAPDIGAIPKI